MLRIASNDTQKQGVDVESDYDDAAQQTFSGEGMTGRLFDYLLQ